MPNDQRRTIISRANRMLRQSKNLRTMSEGLLKESRDLRKESGDIRRSAKTMAVKRKGGKSEQGSD